MICLNFAPNKYALFRPDSFLVNKHVKCFVFILAKWDIPSKLGFHQVWVDRWVGGRVLSMLVAAAMDGWMDGRVAVSKSTSAALVWHTSHIPQEIDKMQ